MYMTGSTLHIIPSYNHIGDKSAKVRGMITSTANSVTWYQFKNPLNAIKQQQKDFALSSYREKNHPFTHFTGRIRSSRHQTLCGKKCLRTRAVMIVNSTNNSASRY